VLFLRAGDFPLLSTPYGRILHKYKGASINQVPIELPLKKELRHEEV